MRQVAVRWIPDNAFSFLWLCIRQGFATIAMPSIHTAAVLLLIYPLLILLISIQISESEFLNMESAVNINIVACAVNELFHCRMR